MCDIQNLQILDIFSTEIQAFYDATNDFSESQSQDSIQYKIAPCVHSGTAEPSIRNLTFYKHFDVRVTR